MTTAAEQVKEVRNTLNGSRIAKETRKELSTKLNAITRSVGSLPVDVEHIGNPLTDATNKYYWEFRDRDTARVEAPANVSARAVELDYLSDREFAEGRSPGARSPRVEVSVTVDSHKLVGDLSADEATQLAMQLLAAAQLVK